MAHFISSILIVFSTELCIIRCVKRSEYIKKEINAIILQEEISRLIHGKRRGTQPTNSANIPSSKSYRVPLPQPHPPPPPPPAMLKGAVTARPRGPPRSAGFLPHERPRGGVAPKPPNPVCENPREGSTSRVAVVHGSYW